MSSLARWLPNRLTTAIPDVLRSLFTNLDWRSATILSILFLVLRHVLSLLVLALKLAILAIVLSAAIALVSLSDVVTLNYARPIQPSTVGADYSRLLSVNWRQIESLVAHHLAILTLAALTIFLLHELFARNRHRKKPEVARFTEIWT